MFGGFSSNFSALFKNFTAPVYGNSIINLLFPLFQPENSFARHATLQQFHQNQPIPIFQFKFGIPRIPFHYTCAISPQNFDYCQQTTLQCKVNSNPFHYIKTVSMKQERKMKETSLLGIVYRIFQSYRFKLNANFYIFRFIIN